MAAEKDLLKYVNEVADMKPVNLQTLIIPVIGWVYDFQKDNNRLPDSLEDLIANKSPERDYDPERAISRNKKNGFCFTYAIQKSTAFKIKITKENTAVVYDSPTDTLSFFTDDKLQDKIVLSSTP